MYDLNRRIPLKLVVWAFFGHGGATIGEVAGKLRSTELIGTVGIAEARRVVRRVVADWERSIGRTHRELERVSAGRYRAVFKDREPRSRRSKGRR